MIAGPSPQAKRWTLEEYHRLIDLGALGPESRVELVEGELVDKMSQKPKHSNTVTRLAQILARLMGENDHVREEKPVSIGESEPEPDLTIVRGPLATYDARHPEPRDIALLIEVSDTTLDYDRGRKAAVYARGGVTEYWIVDLTARRLEVRRGPRSDGGWDEIRSFAEEASIEALFLPKGKIVLRDVFPAAD